MKNRPITVDSEICWISRSIGVSTIVATLNNLDKPMVLAIKRGKNNESYPGYWSLPGGYLDFDETLIEGCLRELYEETNVTLKEEQLKFHSIDSNPNNYKQNIIVRYIAILDYDVASKITFNCSNSNGEVETIKWISLDDIDNYKWAFDFSSVLKNLVI